jgi:hypothetical protein
VKCAKCQRTLSRGFDNPDFADLGGPEVLPVVSRKQGGRRWTASPYNEGNDVGTLTAYAYCEKRHRDYRQDEHPCSQRLDPNSRVFPAVKRAP